ncbi:hypothetical protein [Fructobacillus cardui]|uniref:hypothetical protein n=1 Tax=Fructobacillus cardui TaxID=2893170 RepID=UPI00200B9D90|nr:hypothetical protein [Fructobacillus cardui]MCK8628146.1 hypothetical protein [Fructobacillus cardui]
MDYFELYKLSLRIINDNHPSYFQNFLDSSMSYNETSNLRKKFGDESVIDTFMEIIKNQIDDNIIKGSVTLTKDDDLISINGLTTLGHEYLKQLDNQKFFNKLKSIAKSTGKQITVTTVSSLISKLLF